MADKLSPKWRAEIEQEYAALQADEELIHNQDLHKRILSSWRQTSPMMWARLQQAGLADKLAFVLQQRMWTEMDSLMEGGYPVTDAREQAEREHLMLEPEQDEDPESEAVTQTQ